MNKRRMKGNDMYVYRYHIPMIDVLYICRYSIYIYVYTYICTIVGKKSRFA